MEIKPTIIVVMGATGDLMARKIVPALFHLYKKGNLPKMIRIIGFARRPIPDSEFREMVREMLKRHNTIPTSQFLQFFSYHQGTFGEKNDYYSLGKKLGMIDGKWHTCANKLFYLAVPPQDYETILHNLADTGLTAPCSPEEGWTRVLVEKPFGKDFVTSQKLDELLGALFQEEQIYRIDHYLAKEMLQNIISFRFGNNWFEEGWNGKDVEKIEIRLWESLGVEKRGLFYDGVGALRDVGQNHLLQMLALVTMDNPQAFDAKSIRKKRAHILRFIQPPEKEDVKTMTYRAQYKGYTSVKGVRPNSKTETYFKVGVTLENDRWNHIPVILESGKRLPKAQKEIIITFKHPTPCLCPPNGRHIQNKIIFRMEPEESISIHFASKKPGLQYATEERTFKFALRKKEKGRQYVEEYEKLLLDAICGDQTLFVSTDEVREMWRIIDPIIEEWAKGATLLHTYPPDSLKPVIHSKQIANYEVPTIRKQIGIVGLGKMGKNIAIRLKRKGWDVVAYNRTAEVTKSIEQDGIHGAYSLKKLVQKLKKPRIVWVMLPAGKPLDDVLFGRGGLSSLLQPGDTIIDGSNSYYEDTKKRYKKASVKKIQYVDVGVSGGPGGALEGACLMVGGDQKLFRKLEGLYLDMATYGGIQFFNGSGAGHFVKMVHNGIEYGMMQAIAEGFAINRKSEYSLDLHKVAAVYNRGSVIESRLLGWLKNALELYGNDLKEVSGSVKQTGEGKWTVETAKKMKIPVPVIEESVTFRTRSEKKPSYTGKILSALRNQFGGHSPK